MGESMRKALVRLRQIIGLRRDEYGAVHLAPGKGHFVSVVKASQGPCLVVRIGRLYFNRDRDGIKTFRFLRYQ
jgi:hypothetical protein